VAEVDVRNTLDTGASAGDGQHRGRQINAECKSFVRQTRRVAG
jgi:hypothetical protein